VLNQVNLDRPSVEGLWTVDRIQSGCGHSSSWLYSVIPCSWFKQLERRYCDTWGLLPLGGSRVSHVCLLSSHD